MWSCVSGFIEFVVAPLFAEWHRFNPTKLSQSMLNNLHQNKASWDIIIAEAEVAMETKDSSGCSSEEENQDLREGVKENININVNVHCEDVPEDCILEGRFECPSQFDDFVKDSCFPRRHSLPPQFVNPDVMQLFPRRGSFPKLKVPSNNGTTNSRVSRRHSLPISMNAHNPVMLDKLAVRLASLTDVSLKDNGIDTFSITSRDPSSRSRITSLSADSEATRLLNSLDALLSVRAAGNTGTLLVGKLPPRLRHAPPKEVTFDLECTGPSFHGKSVPYSTSSTSAGSNQASLNSRSSCTNGNGVRQVLRPLDTNSQSCPLKEGGVPRRRSGSEEFANFPLRSQRLRGILYERPRSLSLEIESQPLLRSIGEWRTFSGEFD